MVPLIPAIPRARSTVPAHAPACYEQQRARLHRSLTWLWPGNPGRSGHPDHLSLETETAMPKALASRTKH